MRASTGERLLRVCRRHQVSSSCPDCAFLPRRGRAARWFSPVLFAVAPRSLRNNRGLATLRVSGSPAALGGRGVGLFWAHRQCAVQVAPAAGACCRWHLSWSASLAARHRLSNSPTAERAQLQAQKEALFQAMLRDPGNLDITFAYADVSAKLGDNEAAVSALERMLLFNPNLPRVQLEIGALYFRMGSYEIARTYFEKARRSQPAGRGEGTHRELSRPDHRGCSARAAVRRLLLVRRRSTNRTPISQARR